MENDSETKTTNYYGKKTYYLNPRLAWKKPIKVKTPDYQDDEPDHNHRSYLEK